MYRLPVYSCLRPEVHLAPSAQNTNPKESVCFIVISFNDSGFYTLKWLSTTTHQSAGTLKPLCVVTIRPESCGLPAARRKVPSSLGCGAAMMSRWELVFVCSRLFFFTAALRRNLPWLSAVLMLWLTVVCKYYQNMTAVNICMYIYIFYIYT